MFSSSNNKPSLGASPSSARIESTLQGNTVTSGGLPTPESRTCYQVYFRITGGIKIYEYDRLTDCYEYYLSEVNGEAFDADNAHALLELYEASPDNISRLKRGIQSHQIYKPYRQGRRSGNHMYRMNLGADIKLGSDIDVLSVSLCDQALIDGLFSKVISAGYFAPQAVICAERSVGQSSVYVVRQVTMTMCAASKSDGATPDRIYVLGDLLGSGSYADVYGIQGVIKKDAFSLAYQYKPNCKSKVAKLVFFCESKKGSHRYDQVMTAEECSMMRKLGYFGSVRHSNAVINDGPGGVVILRRFAGKDLFTALDEDRFKRLNKRYFEDTIDRKNAEPDFAALTTEERFLISIASVKALNHVHVRKVKHLDIKPDNILLERDGKVAKVKIIDAGLSADINTKCEPRGTPLYVSPEFRIGLTEKSDIYSLGRVIGTVWGDEEFFIWANDHSVDMYDFILQLEDEEHRCLDLFNAIDIEDSIKSLVSEVIYGMIEYLPGQRIALNTAIEKFQMAYESYCINTRYQELFDQCAVDGVGKKCSRELSAVRNAGACARLLDKQLLGLMGIELTESVLTRLKVFVNEIRIVNPQDFTESALAQKLFKQTVGFKCLDSDALNTISSIKSRIVFIIDKFSSSTKALHDGIAKLKNFVDENCQQEDQDNNHEALRKLLDGCAVIKAEIINCPPDLDDMLRVADHCQRKLDKIQSALETCRLPMQKEESSPRFLHKKN